MPLSLQVAWGDHLPRLSLPGDCHPPKPAHCSDGRHLQQCTARCTEVTDYQQGVDCGKSGA